MSRKSLININSIISSPTHQIPTTNSKNNSVAAPKPSTKSPKNNQITKLITDPDKLVAIGEMMLNSSNWADVIGGLVLMTGLQCSALLKTGILKAHSQFSVMFTDGTLASQEPREIPTLTNSSNVIKAISNVRNSIDTNSLDLKTINASYRPSVIESCARHFNLLIPRHSKDEHLYTYLWRSVYATIATYWYCPNDVSPIDYQAYICGHSQIMEGKNEKIKTHLALQLHYFDYHIGQDLINTDSPVGIKLTEPAVKVRVLLERLVKATGCTPSQLLFNQFFEVTSASGKSKFFLVEDNRQRQLPTVKDPQLIFQGISQLRLHPQIQQFMKLSQKEIDTKFAVN